MKKRITCFSVILVTLLTTAVAYSQVRNIKPIPVELADEPAVVLGGFRITIGDAIKKAIEQNFDILSGSYDVAMTDSQYEQFQKKYSIFLNGSLGAKYAEYPESLSLFQGEDDKTVDATVGIMKMFSSGTTLQAGLQHSYSNKTLNPAMKAFGGVPKTHTPAIFVSVQQELLKNCLGYNDRRTEKILKNASKMQKEAVLYQLSLVVVGVIVDYWTVIVKKTALDNAELQYAETQYVRNVMARNVNLGLVDGYNLNYYNALVAGARASVASSKKAYHDSLRTFLSTINMKEGLEITGTAILTDKLPEIDEEKALGLAYKKRADYQNAVLSLENAKMEYEIRKNEALPSVVAEINATSLAQDEGMGTTYSDALSATYPSIEAKVSVTYPLDDREQKINERNAGFKLKQAKIQLDKYKREVKDDVLSKIEQINTFHELYSRAKEARVQSELFYRKMVVNMRRGRLTASTVKNGLDALVESRQKELEALIYYNVALIQFDVSKNELWERYSIDVDKYIPDGKKKK